MPTNFPESAETASYDPGNSAHFCDALANPWHELTVFSFRICEQTTSNAIGQNDIAVV